MTATADFDPILIPKHERRFTGFNDKIIAMYARGVTAREIEAFLDRAVRYRGLAGVHQFASWTASAVIGFFTKWAIRSSGMVGSSRSAALGRLGFVWHDMLLGDL